jgi:hypothetical protein
VIMIVSMGVTGGIVVVAVVVGIRGHPVHSTR